MINLFDDPAGLFSVLVNDEEQHSLWPSSLDVPPGWNLVHGDDSHQGCLAYIEQNWDDLTPLSARLTKTIQVSER